MFGLMLQFRGLKRKDHGCFVFKIKSWRSSVFSIGKLVIADTNQSIILRAKHILIGNNGELHVGSPDCPYKGNLTISLYGR